MTVRRDACMRTVYSPRALGRGFIMALEGFLARILD